MESDQSVQGPDLIYLPLVLPLNGTNLSSLVYWVGEVHRLLEFSFFFLLSSLPVRPFVVYQRGLCPVGVSGETGRTCGGLRFGTLIPTWYEVMLVVGISRVRDLRTGG